MTCTGSISAVTSAVEAGIRHAGESGPVMASRIIPAPDEQFKRLLI